MTEPGDWKEYQRLVMDKLETLEAGQHGLQNSVNSLKTDLAVLQVKSGMWGALGGIATAGIAFVGHWLTGRRG